MCRSRVRLFEQSVDFRDGKNLRQAAAALWSFDRGGGIVAAVAFGVEKAIELTNGGQMSCHRRRREAALGQPAEISAQLVAGRGGNGFSGRAQIGGEIRQIAGVGGKRVLACAALGREHFEEQLDVGLVGFWPAGHAARAFSAAWSKCRAGPSP